MLDSNDLNHQFETIDQLLKDNPQTALEHAEQLIAMHPDLEPVQLIYARSQRLTEQLDSAQQTLEKLIENFPTSIPARIELALVYNNKQLIQEAINTLTTATEIAPEYHVVWQILSEHLFQIGDVVAGKKALNQYEMIKEYNTKLDQAKEHFGAGRFTEAETECRQLLEQIPTEFRALRLLAQISSHFGHFQISVSILEYCLLQKPDDIGLGIEFSEALLKAKQQNKALQQCERLEQLAPDDLKLASIKSEAQVMTGHYEDALNSYLKLIPVHPRKDLCLLRYGAVLTIVGRTEEAIESYKEAIKLNPELGEAYWSLANLKTFIFSDEDISTIKALLATDSLSNESRTYLNFTMGKALEDNEQFDDSFNFYKTANDACIDANSPINIKQFNSIKSFFTTDFFSQRQTKGHQSNAPIFVVGLRRSGSTLVEQILASHSLVDGTMELTEISSIAQTMGGIDQQGRQISYTDKLGQLNQVELEQLGQQYLDYVEPLRQGGSYFIDKLPSNFQYIGLIKTLFPNAKIIDVRRDPMACGWSLYKHFFAEGSKYSYDLAAIGQHYNNYVDLMSHWHSVLPGQILTINYHDLVNELEQTVKSIVDYCAIDFEQSCLDFYKNKRAVATISSEQVRQPIYQDGLAQWKNYEQHLTSLKSALNN